MKKFITNLRVFKNKNNYLTLVSALILIILLIKTNDFFKNSYLIVNNNYDIRLQKAYDYCSNTGTGYIFKIKKKFNLTEIPKIKNFGISPNQYWIFQDYKKFDNQKFILLFNLDKDGNKRLNLDEYKILDNFKNDCLFLEKK